MNEQETGRRQRWARRAVMSSWVSLGVVACGLQAPETGRASRALEPGSYRLEAVHSGMCLTVADALTGNGTTVEQQPCDGRDSHYGATAWRDVQRGAHDWT